MQGPNNDRDAAAPDPQGGAQPPARGRRPGSAIAALAVAALAVLCAFVPVFGILPNFLLLPICALLIAGALRRHRRERSKGGVRWIAAAALTAVLSVVVMVVQWERFGACRSVPISDALMLTRALQRVCGAACCKPGSLRRVIDSSSLSEAAKELAKERMALIPIRRDGRCIGYQVSVWFKFPCHDSSREWSSTEPQKWTCYRSCAEDGPLLRRQGYRVDCR